jgi:hypothetical protein
VARNGVDIPPAFLSEALPVDVGSYLIEVSAPGYEHLSVEANVTAEGERREVTVPELTREQVAEEPPASPAAAGTVVEEASEAEAAAEPHPAQAREDRPGRRLRRDLGWVGIGVGAAGLLVGGIAGAVVLSEYGALGCGEGACAASPQEASRLNTLRVVSSVGLISGAAIGVAGITLLVTARRGETVVAVTPFVTGDSVGIRGWF